MSQPESSADLAVPAELLEQYLARRDDGDTEGVEDLLERAGTGADQLQSRLAILGELEQLSLLLSEDQGNVPDDIQGLGRFENLRLIGQGGLSKVFVGHDPRLGRNVALKVLSPLSADSDARDLMLAEGRSLARLEHDSIVRVFEIDEVEGFAYIAMERIDGPSLHETLEAMRALRNGNASLFEERAVRAARALESIPARCRLVARLARALQYCHAKGTIHRDVKPGNILIDADGTPKLIDFGLAHLHTENEDETSLGLTQKLVGTPAYITPEQVDQRRTGVSPKSDQFSLGIVLYEVLTLVNPFQASTRDGTLNAVSKAAPPPFRKYDIDVPVDVERIALHCLEREPNDRYADIGELAGDLEAFLDYRAISLRAPSPLRRAQLWLRRNRDEVRNASLVTGTLITALTVYTVRGARAEREQTALITRAALENVPNIEHPKAMEQALDQVIELRALAERQDDVLFAGTLLQEVGGDVQELANATSGRLHALASSAFEKARKAHRARRDDLYLQAGWAWNASLKTERRANPSSGMERNYQLPGQVHLPEGGVLRRLEVRSPLRTYQLADRDQLAAGFYRFSVRDGDTVRETEFELVPWEEKVDRTPCALPAEIASSMVRCPAVPHAYVVGKTDVRIYTTAPYRVSPDPVTWLEAERVLGADLVNGRRKMLLKVELDLPPERLDDESFASLTFSEASEYARHVGARLPTLPELVAAYDRGLVRLAPGQRQELTASFFDDDADARSTVLCEDVWSDLGRPSWSLSRDLRSPVLEPTSFSSKMPVARTFPTTGGFRLAISESLETGGF
ncbi:MAG: protein kinase [bacterium]|nr:protein kinase [bacterium]